MKALKKNIPVIVLILFELTVGILLLVNPEAFTRAAVTCFGILLLVTGVVYLLRWLRDRRSGDAGVMTLILAVLSLVIGCVCTFLTGWVVGLFAVVAVIYGVILILSGVFKAKACLDAKREGLPVSLVTAVSAALSVILGIVIVLNPFTATNFLWIFAGLSLIAEAALDLAAVILSVRAGQAEETRREV